MLGLGNWALCLVKSGTDLHACLFLFMFRPTVQSQGKFWFFFRSGGNTIYFTKKVVIPLFSCCFSLQYCLNCIINWTVHIILGPSSSRGTAARSSPSLRLSSTNDSSTPQVCINGKLTVLLLYNNAIALFIYHCNCIRTGVLTLRNPLYVS